MTRNDWIKIQGIAEFLLWLSNRKHDCDFRTGEILVVDNNDTWQGAFDVYMDEKMQKKEGV